VALRSAHDRKINIITHPFIYICPVNNTFEAGIVKDPDPKLLAGSGSG